MEKLIDAATFNSTLQVIGALVVMGIVLFGGGKLLLFCFERRAKRSDDRHDTASANYVAEIDADKDATTHAFTRLARVEERVDMLYQELSDEKAAKAGLAVEHKHALRDIERLERENTEVKAEIKEQRDGMFKIMQESLTRIIELLVAMQER